jgi:NDP-sugar pyrophosphorylase family protein
MGRRKFVTFGAVLVVGTELAMVTQNTGLKFAEVLPNQTLIEEALSCIDVLGSPVIERMADRFQSAGGTISILVESGERCALPNGIGDRATVRVVSDIFSAIGETLAEFSRNGIEHAFVCSANTYAEVDLLDMFHFHRESRNRATQAFVNDGVLPFWVVDCAAAQRTDLPQILKKKNRQAGNGTSYFIREYVVELQHPRHLRQLASDMLGGRCERGPSGDEIRPGIWIDRGAEVRHGARIVAPAYIGRGSKVMDGALITRCSSIEQDCCVDCGTVIEDSSLLNGTHVGIWLDVCHAVVNGDRMLSLGRDVTARISDPSILRFASSHRVIDPAERLDADGPETAADIKRQHPTGAWQFGANLIQE